MDKDLKGCLAINEAALLYLHAHVSESRQHFLDTISNTFKIFVEKKQCLFEMLWGKAMTTKERTKEIPPGSKVEFVEVIQDPAEIERIAFDLIRNKANEEILIISSGTGAVQYHEKLGILQLVKQVASSSRRAPKIRILLPEDIVLQRNEKRKVVTDLTNSGIEIRGIKKPLQERLTGIIIDQSFVFIIELKDDDPVAESSGEVVTLATYSNNEVRILTHISIFENMWIQAELSGNHRGRHLNQIRLAT
jgi:hypothetical protein